MANFNGFLMYFSTNNFHAVKKFRLSAAEPEKKNFHATTSSRRAKRKYHMFSYHHRKISVRDKFIVAAYDLFRLVRILI